MNNTLLPQPVIATSNRINYGFTLIEIMIALLLGAFLIGGVMQIFVGAKQTNSVQDELARLQENARFAMDILGRDIRMADYRFCINATKKPLANAIDPAVTANGALNSNHALDVPDTIKIVWSTVPCTPVSTVTAQSTYGITPPTAAILPTDTRKLYLNTTGAVVVEGVENMQILYGEDTDMNPVTRISTDYAPNRFIPAGTAGLNMARVVSVRVSLLLQTQDFMASQPISYTYNGGTVTPADRRIRRVVTSTFALRNRIR